LDEIEKTDDIIALRKSLIVESNKLLDQLETRALNADYDNQHQPSPTPKATNLTPVLEKLNETSRMLVELSRRLEEISRRLKHPANWNQFEGTERPQRKKQRKIV